MFEKYFDTTIKYGASDLHLSTGILPAMRLNGDLIFIDDAEIITPENFLIFTKEILPPEKFNMFQNFGNVDFAFNYLNFRVRANFYKDLNGGAAALRFINPEIKTLDELGLPDILKSLCKRRRGIILITAPSGHGKSTTLAAMINEINNTRPYHIITLEDPIEHIFTPTMSIINQREIENHTGNFSETLKFTLRQDPDVIMIGELRDYQSISAAVSAAETGHLILATLHTQDASQAVERIIDVFPEHQQNQIRTQLAYSLICVCSQQLIPNKFNNGRVCANEILIVNAAVRNLILEGKISGLKNAMLTGSIFNMHTMEQDLIKLFVAGKISRSSVLEYAYDKSYVEKFLE